LRSPLRRRRDMMRVVDVADPRCRRQDREQETQSDGGDTDLGALAGQTLAEGQDGEEGQRHQRRHQPGPVQDRGAHGQPLIASTSSRSIEARFRYRSRTMARPTATSAAATVMTKRAKTWPTTLPCSAPKATRLMLTALRISSIDMSTITPLRRASTP